MPRTGWTPSSWCRGATIMVGTKRRQHSLPLDKCPKAPIELPHSGRLDSLDLKLTSIARRSEIRNVRQDSN
jgi:hypothetical protein